MSKYLTESEVNNLPDGTIVEITWSGGNGPHKYRIATRHGEKFAANVKGDPALEFYNPIRNVHPSLTRVSLT